MEEEVKLFIHPTCHPFQCRRIREFMIMQLFDSTKNDRINALLNHRLFYSPKVCENTRNIWLNLRLHRNFFIASLFLSTSKILNKMSNCTIITLPSFLIEMSLFFKFNTTKWSVLFLHENILYFQSLLNLFDGPLLLLEWYIAPAPFQII